MMQRFDHRFVAMGGPCRLRIDCSEEIVALQALRAAETEVRRLERKYSRYLSESLTSKINRAAGGAPVKIDVETAGLLAYADTAWRESGGLFDLTSGILHRAWDFKSGHLPSQADLDALLPLIGWEQVQRDEQKIRLPVAGMELDFGGCGKEYASDCVAAILRRHGIEHGLVDLAGDMVALGTQAGGGPWTIGIRHPGQRSRAIAQIELVGNAMASSGDYERCLEIDGRRYGHILDPRSGWPVQGLAAVSVLAEQCLVAGSAATIALLKPVEEAPVWLQALGLPWLAVDANGNCSGSIVGAVRLN